MNEVIEQLRQHNQDSFHSLELPSEDDLVIIEEELLLPIPREFKDFLLTVSDVVYGSLEPVTVSDPVLHTHLPEVAALAWEQGLPRDLLPLCQYQEGFYCVTQQGQVTFWQNHERQEGEWDSIWHWVESVWLSSSAV